MWSYVRPQPLAGSGWAPWLQEVGLGGARGSRAGWSLAMGAYPWLDPAFHVHPLCTPLAGSHRHGNAENGAVSGQGEPLAENGISERGAGFAPSLGGPLLGKGPRRTRCPGDACPRLGRKVMGGAREMGGAGEKGAPTK